MPTASKSKFLRNAFFCCIILIGGIAIGVATSWQTNSSEKIKQIKILLGIEESQTEKLRAYVKNRINSQNSLEFKDEKLMPSGDLCGQVGIENPIDKSIKFSRFIVSPRNFVEVGDLGFMALDDPQWKLYADIQGRVIKTLGGYAKDYNRMLLLKRWETHCGESISIEEMASGFRENIKNNLKDPKSAQFREEKIVREMNYCGEVNAKNSYGGYVGFKRFYVILGGVLQIEGSEIVPLAKEGSTMWGAALKYLEETKQKFGSDPNQIKAMNSLLFNRMWSSSCS